MPNREPSPKASASFSPSQAVLMTISVTPIAASFSICQTIKGLPPTSSKGFGVCSVSGRIRLPSPAAKIIAFIQAATSYEPYLASNAGITLSRINCMNGSSSA